MIAYLILSQPYQFLVDSFFAILVSKVKGRFSFLLIAAMALTKLSIN